MAISMFFPMMFIYAIANPNKIHHRLLQSASDSSNILINIKHCFRRALADVSEELDQLQHVHQKASLIRRHLTTHAEVTQASVHDLLQKLDDHHSGDVRKLWITNQVAVRNASRHLIEQLAELNDVEIVAEDVMIANAQTISKEPGFASTIPKSWGIQKVNVEPVWATGNHGQGAKAGFIDSGMFHQHSELKGRNLLAWKDVVLRKNYAYDDFYHGTHVTSIAVGEKVGIANRASIVVCKAFDSRGMLSSAVTECAQFFICPYGNCNHTPHVINNSWSFFDSWDTSFKDFAQAWRAAGIVGVSSTGNNFRAQTCYDLELKPPSVFESIISVGSTTENDKLSDFSRQGSIQYMTKPDLTAPGSDIVAASNDGVDTYSSRYGTSMAVPHVVGAILLMVTEGRKHNCSLSFDKVDWILRESSVTETLQVPQFGCGYKGTFPNVQYGAGRLNIEAAVAMVTEICTA